MSDREQLETSRAYGLRKRHEPRLRRARKTPEYALGRQEALDQKCGCILGLEHTLGDHVHGTAKGSVDALMDTDLPPHPQARSKRLPEGIYRGGDGAAPGRLEP